MIVVYLGHTRTICTLIALYMASKKRVLVIGLNEESCRQLTKDTTSVGIKDACLVVSSAREYKRLDSATRATLDPYVHLRHSNLGSQTDSTTSHTTDAWNYVAFEGHDSKHPLPSVAISLFTEVAGAFSRKNEPTKGDHHWATQVARLVHAGSIDAVIIADASQLWEGHALSLLPKLTNVENIVLVGNVQLEATESGYRSLLPSLLSSASLCSDIPHTKLTETYGILPSIAAFLSSTAYDGRLSLNRCAEVQKKFDSYLQYDIRPSLLNPLAQALVQRLLAMRLDPERPASLAWVHIDSPRNRRISTLDHADSPEVKHIASVAADLIRAYYSAAGRPASFEVRSKLAILTPFSEVGFYILHCFSHPYLYLRFLGNDAS